MWVDMIIYLRVLIDKVEFCIIDVVEKISNLIISCDNKRKHSESEKDPVIGFWSLEQYENKLGERGAGGGERERVVILLL